MSNLVMDSVSIYRAKAFSDEEGIEQKSIFGNPAGIVFCEDGLPDRTQMAKMAREINEPIVAFLNQREKGEFDIQFYFPDGEACFLCGHGTLVTAYFIHQRYGYEKIALKINEHDLIVHCTVDAQKKVRAYLSSYTLDPLAADKLPVYLGLLGLKEEDILVPFYSPDLNDGVLVLKDCSKLRAISPDYRQLSEQIRKDHLRAIMITAASLNDAIDYEIRIFCPYVEEDEDISCGSANCYLLPYWKTSLQHKAADDELTILCPFKPESKTFGGIEHGNYYAADGLVSISGQIHEL